MSDDSRQSAGKTADLARVRDNQRRSRARRKEYLHELETKYRTCEQVGVGASAEIQAAARQVANENKRLRQLLMNHGIPTNEPNGESSSVATLESMIGKKRACGGGGDISCEKSPAAVRQDYSQMPDRGLRPLQMRIERQPSPQSGNDSSNGRSPLSAASATSTLQPDTQPFATLPTQPPQIYTTPRPQTTSYVTSSSSADIVYGHSPGSLYGNYTDYTQQQHNDLFGDNFVHPPNMDSYADIPHSMDLEPQHSSCRDIADAIRYVRPSVTQQELDDEMGCQPGSDCKVPNYEAFDLMDRLSNSERR